MIIIQKETSIAHMARRPFDWTASTLVIALGLKFITINCKQWRHTRVVARHTSRTSAFDAPTQLPGAPCIPQKSYDPHILLFSDQMADYDDYQYGNSAIHKL